MELHEATLLKERELPLMSLENLGQQTLTFPAFLDQNVFQEGYDLVSKAP